MASMQEPTRQENAEEAKLEAAHEPAAEAGKADGEQGSAEMVQEPAPEPTSTASVGKDGEQGSARPAAHETAPAPEPTATASAAAGKADGAQGAAEPGAHQPAPAPEPTTTVPAAAEKADGKQSTAESEEAGKSAQLPSTAPDAQTPQGVTEPAPAKPAEASQPPQEAEHAEFKPSQAPTRPPDAEEEKATRPQRVEAGEPEGATPGEKSVSAVKSMFEQPSPTKPQAPSSKPEGGFKHRSASSAAAAAVAPQKSPQKSEKANGTTHPAASTHAPSSAHDHKNTVNVAQLLKSGSFSRLPGKDIIPYAELRALRLEDGIDATQKEGYLSSDEFEQVFQMPREAYEKLPGWKKVQAKKNVQLF